MGRDFVPLFISKIITAYYPALYISHFETFETCLKKKKEIIITADRFELQEWMRRNRKILHPYFIPFVNY